MEGKLHSIETFGTVDGPGVRFVVFFQGCPMRCLYCHNPDTQDFGSAPLMLDSAEVIARMTRNLPFYRTGGITATGGEPLMQIDFLNELFTLAKSEGIHTCLDTSGVSFSEGDSERFDKLMSVTDLVMLDIKHTDSSSHLKLCGMDNSAPIGFLNYLTRIGKPTRIRYVLVPGYTDSEADLKALGDLLSYRDNIEKIEILPYHELGKVKYEKLGRPYMLDGVSPPTQDEVSKAEKIILESVKK